MRRTVTTTAAIPATIPSAALLAVLVLAVASQLAGCFLFGGPKRVTVVPLGDGRKPLAEARIVVDGKPVGQGTTAVEIAKPISVTIEPPAGWLVESFALDAKSPSPLEVALRPDEVYRATEADVNQIVNRWLTLNITKSAEANDEWWAAVAASVSGQDFEMEMMDARSGFIRTAWKQSRFANGLVRRRFVGNVVAKSPLQFRIKYEVEIADGENWIGYPRGFRQDMDALAEMRNRISQ
jgi:hypothetical protein